MDRDELLPSEKDFAVSIPARGPVQEIPAMGIELGSTQPTLALLQAEGEAVKRDQPILQALGPDNSIATCQHCRATVRTTVKYTPTSRTLIASALWCFICCCCCIPYCCDSAKNSDHYCPACTRYIGTYEK